MKFFIIYCPLLFAEHFVHASVVKLNPVGTEDVPEHGNLHETIELNVPEQEEPNESPTDLHNNYESDENAAPEEIFGTGDNPEGDDVDTKEPNGQPSDEIVTPAIDEDNSNIAQHTSPSREYGTETITDNLDVFQDDPKTNTLKLWKAEKNAANMADIIGANPHIYQPDEYINLDRRFVAQYPYTEIKKHKISTAAPDNEIVPIEAPPAIVEMVAKQSALIEALKPDPVDDSLTKKILRSGDYWNGVWVEVNPDTLSNVPKHGKTALRTSQRSDLGVIKARIKPGNEFYDLVVGMKKISPKLLYIINVNK